MKNDKQRSIRFKGYDWTELLQLQRIATNWPEVPIGFKIEAGFMSEEDQKSAYIIREYFSRLSCEEESRELKKVAKKVRKFLLACAKGPTYNGPAIKGIANIKNDSVMLSWVDNNLERLWY